MHIIRGLVLCVHVNSFVVVPFFYDPIVIFFFGDHRFSSLIVGLTLFPVISSTSPVFDDGEKIMKFALITEQFDSIENITVYSS